MRPMLPASELTPEQIRKRIYNEKYRAKKKDVEKNGGHESGKKSAAKKPRKKPAADISSLEKKNFSNSNEKNSGKKFEKNFSNPKEKILSSVRTESIKFSGLCMSEKENFSNETEENFSNYNEKFLSNILPFRQKKEELPEDEDELFLLAHADLLAENDKLKAENKDLLEQLLAARSNPPRRSLFRFLSPLVGILAVIPIPVVLILQLMDLIEVSGNRGSLYFAAALEYAVIIAAAACGVMQGKAQKFFGWLFVIGLTTTMALFVISGVEKKAVSTSESYRRMQEERHMLIADRNSLQSQMDLIPSDYKTRRAEFQTRIEQKALAISEINSRLDKAQKNGGGEENFLSNIANIASRILLMLLEAWIVHYIVSRLLRKPSNEKAAII